MRKLIDLDHCLARITVEPLDASGNLKETVEITSPWETEGTYVRPAASVRVIGYHAIRRLRDALCEAFPVDAKSCNHVPAADDGKADSGTCLLCKNRIFRGTGNKWFIGPTLHISEFVALTEARKELDKLKAENADRASRLAALQDGVLDAKQTADETLGPDARVAVILRALVAASREVTADDSASAKLIEEACERERERQRDASGIPAYAYGVRPAQCVHVVALAEPHGAVAGFFYGVCLKCRQNVRTKALTTPWELVPPGSLIPIPAECQHEPEDKLDGLVSTNGEVWVCRHCRKIIKRKGNEPWVLA